MQVFLLHKHLNSVSAEFRKQRKMNGVSNVLMCTNKGNTCTYKCKAILLLLGSLDIYIIQYMKSFLEMLKLLSQVALYTFYIQIYIYNRCFILFLQALNHLIHQVNILFHHHTHKLSVYLHLHLVRLIRAERDLHIYIQLSGK